MIKLNRPTLIMKSTDVYNTVVRDWQDFQAIGIHQEKLDAFKQKIEAGTEDFDQLYLVPQVELTARKNKQRAELEQMFNRSMIILHNVLTPGQKAKGLVMASVSSYSDAGLFFAADTALRLMRTNLEAIAGYGLDVDFIDQMEIANANFRQTIAERNAMMKERDWATQKRQQVFDDLYADLLFFAQIGKSVYKTHDPARYNDYILGFGATKSKTEDQTEPEDSMEVQPPPDDEPLDTGPDNVEPNIVGF